MAESAGTAPGAGKQNALLPCYSMTAELRYGTGIAAKVLKLCTFSLRHDSYKVIPLWR